MKIMLKSVPGTNQYKAIRVKFLAQGNNGGLWWGSNSRLTGIHRSRVRRATHCATPPLKHQLLRQVDFRGMHLVDKTCLLISIGFFDVCLRYRPAIIGWTDTTVNQVHKHWYLIGGESAQIDFIHFCLQWI